MRFRPKPQTLKPQTLNPKRYTREGGTQAHPSTKVNARESARESVRARIRASNKKSESKSANDTTREGQRGTAKKRRCLRLLASKCAQANTRGRASTQRDTFEEREMKEREQANKRGTHTPHTIHHTPHTTHHTSHTTHHTPHTINHTTHHISEMREESDEKESESM